MALKLETWLLAAFPVAANPPRRWFVHSADVGPERPLVDEFVAFVIAPYARGDRALARLG